MPPRDRPRKFNFNKFRRGSKILRSKHLKPQRPSNGFTPAQMENLMRIIPPTSIQEKMGAFQCLPLDNYGHSTRTFPPTGTAPVTDATLSRSALKSVRIHSVIRDDANSPRLDPIEMPLPSFEKFTVSAEAVKLFSSANDIPLTRDIGLFDEKFTNKFKDYDFPCEPNISPAMYIRTPSRIAKKILYQETEVQRIVDEDLFRPITEFLLQPSTTDLQREMALVSFMHRLVELPTINEHQFKSIKERLYNHRKTEEVKAIEDYRTLKEELKSYLSSAVAALGLVSAGNINVELVKESLLLYFGTRAIPDFTVSFTTLLDDIKKVLDFPKLNNRTRKVISIANACLIEAKLEETQSLVIIKQMLESSVLSSSAYRSDLCDYLIKRSLNFTGKNLLLSDNDLKTFAVNDIEDAILESDLDGINQFLETHRNSLRNLGLSIGKLVAESLISNCDHMMLTDYYNYLFVKICPVTSLDDSAQTGDGDDGHDDGDDGDDGDSLEKDAPSLLEDKPSPAMSNLRFQVFFVDSQDESTSESIRFRVTCFLMDSLSKFGKGSEEFAKSEELQLKSKQQALSSLNLSGQLNKNSKSTGSGNVGPETSNVPDEQSHFTEDQGRPRDLAGDFHQAGGSGDEVYFGDDQLTQKSDSLVGPSMALGDPPVSAESNATVDLTSFTATNQMLSENDHSGSSSHYSVARIVNTNLNNCIPIMLRNAHVSSKSVVVTFLEGDCHPDLLMSLGVNLPTRVVGDHLDRLEHYIPEGDKKNQLILKILVDPSARLDASLDSSEARTVDRLEVEVSNLLRVRTGEQNSNVLKFPKLVSHGYLNQVSIPIPGLLNALPESLSMLSGPFIFMEEPACEGIQFALNCDIIRVLTMAQKKEIVEIFSNLHNDIHLVHGDVREDNILAVYDTSGLSVLRLFGFSCYEDIKENFDVSRIRGFQLVDFELSEPVSDANSEDSALLIEREMNAVYRLLDYTPV